jgi:LPXTG-motif cell wall-anchored protein
MKPLQGKCILILAGGLAMGFVFFSLLAPAPVRAGAAQPVLPEGSSIQPDTETPIQMEAQIVTMNIRPATEVDNTLVRLAPKYYPFQFQSVWYPVVAEVEANFTLKNPTSQAVNMTVWFPLASALGIVDWKLSPAEIVPRLERFRVSVDGNPVDYAVTERPNQKGVDRPALPWAGFPVTFPGKKGTVIHLSYALPLQPSISGIEMTLVYVFQTGAGWAGPDGQAELIVNLPYPASTETLAGIPSGSLRMPPYYRPSKRAELPSGVVLEGNQARWTWKDFEPGPGDDFAIWLLQPGQWQTLENARAAVQANPEDGQAWLNLASSYYSLSSNGPGFPTIFGSCYLPQGIQAYKTAAELLPERAAPHAGLALLTLELYMVDENAPPEAIRSVLDEYQIAIELETRYPSLARETGRTHWLLAALKTDLEAYFPNDATATAEWAAWSTLWAKRGTEAASLGTASAMPAQKPTSPSTPLPAATPASATAETTGNGQSQVILGAAGVLVLGFAGYLVIKRSRKKKGSV